MVKHILGQAFWQCAVLFVFLFGGEYLIPESDPRHAYDPDASFMTVFPGRATDWSGNPLYTSAKLSELGPSRHLTFIFTAFVMMQITNMVCCRKVHDEWNIIEGLKTNLIFNAIVFGIFVG